MNDDGTAFHVDFKLSPSSSLKDVQYVLELSEESPATFIQPPSSGGTGCNHSRVYGKHGDAPALLKINDDADKNGRIELRAGWATGHEAVTLVPPLFMTVGGVVDSADDGEEEYYDDDQAEAEYEEEAIEEERLAMEQEVELAEKDAIEALEEKRMERDTAASGEIINEAEEEVVQVLEEERKRMDKALNTLKDEIIIEKAANERKHREKMEEMHTSEKEKERMRQIHAQEMAKKHRTPEERMEHIAKRYQRENDKHNDRDNNNHNNNDDPRQKKLQQFEQLHNSFQQNKQTLQNIDQQEHNRAHATHHEPPKEQIDIDTAQIKESVHKHMMERHQRDVQRIQRDSAESQQKERQKFHDMHDTMEKLGVHEMISNRDVKLTVDRIKGKLKKGLPRGGEAAHHGDTGVPLPKEARHGLLGLFGLMGLVGVVRWGLERRRRSTKGHMA